MSLQKIKFLILILMFFAGCGDNSNLENNGTNKGCDANINEILTAPGSPDAPVLKIGYGIESSIYSLRWSGIENVDYYELDESYCPDFIVYCKTYQVYDTYFAPPNQQHIDNYYRVRAVLADTVTGWSKVIKR